MKAFRIIAVILVLLLSSQTIFAGRYYDSATGRFTSVDPHAVNYPGWSPYNYCMNNPLVVIDPNGLDTLYFDSGGNYLADQTRSGEGDHVGYYTDSDGNQVEFGFNDQLDAESILSSTTENPVANEDGFFLTGIRIGENKIGELLLMANNVLSQSNIIGYFFTESQQEGNMDYVNRIGMFDNSLNNNVTVIDGLGYNNFDLGNYYWGRTLGMAGFSPRAAKAAAQAFERLFHKRDDNPTDQRAIENGVKKR